MDILPGDRHAGDKQLPGELEIAVIMLGRYATFIGPEEVNTLPVDLIDVGFAPQKRIELFRRAASGQGCGKPSSFRHCHIRERSKRVGSRAAERLHIREYPDH
jgi:hypothetical protein